ncbi:fungal-specific transcription factor domain-containing protein [Plectosphaerella plurivora]|uniref:Fungal-specific transcription factor domain-containing protein n=1 Tax=Plectosphaerella plurivora TaxID=936078 RepID=A0A9P8VA19_9PEZI|nr:fungal-specific transcription factor domain-containing protein [Plectosphaerella plurivora]
MEGLVWQTRIFPAAPCLQWALWITTTSIVFKFSSCESLIAVPKPRHRIRLLATTGELSPSHRHHHHLDLDLDLDTSQHPMTQPLPSRSHGACFTCRIRHRKCDETAPQCVECTSRRIECHGYGPQPAWAKDPARLREEVQKIKTQIKQHLRKSKGIQRPRRRSSHSDSDDMGATATAPDFQTFREAELLMHYLDRIFMIQFPYYTEKGSLTSRGWLFWRLTKKGPLRQAALTLAAFHRQTLSQHGADALERLMLFYHMSSMRELRAVVSRHQVNRSAARHDEWIEFMACGTALISFEVFSGGAGTWMPHLNALVSSFQDTQLDDLEPVPSASALDDEADIERHEYLVTISSAQRFLIAELLWFDIISCIATEAAPRSEYRRWLEETDVDISCVTGCENWAMIAIGDIATLCAHFDEIDPSKRAARVLKMRQDVDGEVTKFNSQTSHANITQSVTRIHAAAILVFLHALAHDTQAFDPDVASAVDDLIEAMRRLPVGVTVRGMPWPLET